VPLPSTAFPEDLVIVVTTPTGQIGRPIIDRFLGVGEEIRVTARAPSRLSPQVRDRVSVVQGSHGDIDGVGRSPIRDDAAVAATAVPHARLRRARCRPAQ
jgi:uncharacterized protein YbjT (DUF2867 family)